MSEWIEEVNTSKGCVFCEDCGFYLFRRIIGIKSIDELVIIRTENFIVIPDIAPLMEGHVLIVPYQHCLSVRDILKDHREEILKLKNEIRRRMIKQYCPPVFFEHGPTESKCAGECVDHAHLHCLPTQMDFLPHLADWLNPTPLATYSELSSVEKNHIPYLYIEQTENDLYVVPLHTDSTCMLPSQYLRQVVASSCGLEVWDWRQIVSNKLWQERNLTNVFNTVERLRG